MKNIWQCAFHRFVTAINNIQNKTKQTKKRIMRYIVCQVTEWNKDSLLLVIHQKRGFSRSAKMKSIITSCTLSLTQQSMYFLLLLFYPISFFGTWFTLPGSHCIRIQSFSSHIIWFLLKRNLNILRWFLIWINTQRISKQWNNSFVVVFFPEEKNFTLQWSYRNSISCNCYQH